MTVGDLRESRMDHIRRTGDYDAAYCPLCSCTKNGWADEPNGIQEPCESSACLCHGDFNGETPLVYAMRGTK